MMLQSCLLTEIRSLLKYYGIKCAEIAYADGSYYYDGGINKYSSFELVGYDANDELIPADRGFNMAKRLELKVTFDNSKIAPKTHAITLNIVNNEAGESESNLTNYVRGVVNFNINVKTDNAAMFNWVGKDAYFDDAFNAHTYTELLPTSTYDKVAVEMNLNQLFELENVNLAYVAYEEEDVPYGEEWLNVYSDKYVVTAKKSYAPRKFTAMYYPFGNKNIAVTHDFTLEVRSEIKEATASKFNKKQWIVENNAVSSLKRIGTESNPIVISKTNETEPFVMGYKNFYIEDIYGKALNKANFTLDERVDKNGSYEYVLDENAKKYLSIMGTLDYDKFQIRRAEVPGIVNSPICVITFIVKDRWGAKTEIPCYFKVVD